MVSSKWVSQSTATNARLCEDSGSFLYVDLMVTSPPDSHTLTAITMVNDRGLSSSVSCPSPSILEELHCAAPIQCHELAIRLACKLLLVLLNSLSRTRKIPENSQPSQHSIYQHMDSAVPQPLRISRRYRRLCQMSMVSHIPLSI